MIRIATATATHTANKTLLIVRIIALLVGKTERLARLALVDIGLAVRRGQVLMEATLVVVLRRQSRRTSATIALVVAAVVG